MFLDSGFKVLLGAADVVFAGCSASDFVDHSLVSTFASKDTAFISFGYSLVVARFVRKVKGFLCVVEFGHQVGL